MKTLSRKVTLKVWQRNRISVLYKQRNKSGTEITQKE